MTAGGGRRPDPGRGQRPMLVLGEGAPAQEDTTPELLERRRRELELRQAQVERDRLELEKDAARRTGLPPHRLGERRRMGVLARVSCGLAALLIGAGTLMLPHTAQSEEVEQFVTLDTDRAGWVQAAAVMDEETADLLGGQELLPTSVSALRSGRLTDEIAPGDGPTDRFFHEQVAAMTAALEARPADAQHVRETWDETRDRVAGAVRRDHTVEAGDALATPHPVTPHLLWWGTALLGMAALGGLVTGPRLVGALAALAMVPAALLAVDAGSPAGPVTDELAAHREEVARVDRFSQAMRVDQRVLIGAQQSSRSSSHWEYSQIADREARRPHEQELLDTWQDARSRAADLDLATAAPEEVHAVLAPVVEAGQAVLRDRELTVASAREAVVEAAEGPVDLQRGVVAGVVALALALAAAALAGRGRTSA